MSFQGKPQLKGKTLFNALRTERAVHCFFIETFSVGFACGAVFILWLLLW